MLRSSALDAMSGNPVEHQFPSQKLSLGGGNASLRGQGSSANSSGGRVGTPNPMAGGGSTQSHSSALMSNNVSLRNVHIVSPAGLSPDQAQRAQSLLAAGAPSTVGPRLKAMELLHFWVSSESAVRAIEDQIADVLRVAGINNKSHSPRSSSSDSTASSNAYSPKVPSVHKLGARSPHTASLQSATAHSAASSIDAAEITAVEQPPELELAIEGPREDTTSTALSIGGGTDNVPSRSSSSSSLALTLGSTHTVDHDASPRRRPLGRNLTAPHPKSPRSASPSSSFHGSGSNNNLSAHYHIVDEVDAAHARGALSPRSVSPAMQLNQDMGGVPQSPLEALQANNNDMGNSLLRRSPASMDAPPSLTTTPRRPGDEHRDGRPSRSPSPAGSIRMSDDLNQARGNSSHSQRKMSNLSSTSDKPERVRYASYQDIPRFYFAEGKPQTQSTTLIGPHSNKHENPHLTLFDGVAVPVGGQAQLLLAQQQMGGASALDLSSLQPQGPKLSPMLPLAVMEDEDVVPFIQREFARLPAPPVKQQPAPQQRATKGSSVLRRPTTSSNAPSKQEQAYRQALTATMHRVCTQAFGLPKYIGQLVFRKLSSDAEVADETLAMPTQTSLRPGTSSGASSGSGAGNGNITVQQVKEFYEKYLRFKSIVRRMFEVLIATSKVQSAVPPAALGGAMSGMAPSALPGAAAAGGADQRRNYLVRDDFAAYLDVLLESHPGLGFLRQTQDFQGKYLETVVIRIFYDLDRYDRGRITWPEFEHSKLPDAIRQVDATDDINTVLNYFSYEHFYVLYCRFWELDEDRDMLISQQDLQRYSPDGTMNPQIVERVFQGHGRKLSCKTRGKMNYEDFVWFCLSEEDKSSPKAIRYWFRVLDLDGDGILCGHELESFYAHTKKQLLQMTTEGISFSDVICQVADMLPFQLKQGIRLGDMLAAPQAAHVALNMIMNVIRFLHFEQRDPFVAHHDRLLGGFERNDWDRFARQEYDRMAQEADGE